MKVHYINILLFALPLNILEHNQRNHYTTPHDIPTTRLLCECDLYMPNYDNDPQMKEVMENFNKQTQQRFQEYDERLQSKRKLCKDKCHKVIEKIILKDKLEKQMEQHLTTLDTKINTDDIPTCICEKSLADKTENFCLNCGKTMGAVAPAWSLVSGLGYAAWTHYVHIAIAKAISEAGINEAIKGVKGILELGKLSGVNFSEFVNSANYMSKELLAKSLYELSNKICVTSETGYDSGAFCLFQMNYQTETKFIKLMTFHTKHVVQDANLAAANASEVASANAAITTSNLNIAIMASIVSIVVIVLVMIIIYLILRYFRKKKIKKKHQYIKLLKE
ncbi:rifin [Plasmodium reichenowi]|uniref:Rifin n=1 Tax=Plasmodium reichenowi TaxID=5854 RepID=A0A060RQZ2_PLARE|nr:rifin [Plasmodium reichenowi]